MTNTKILEELYTITKTLDSDSQSVINKIIKGNTSWSFDTIETTIANMIIQLKSDIATEEAKKSGKSNQLKAFKDILKLGSKSTNEALHYTKTINGYQYAMDSRILAKINPIEGFKECPENLEYPDVEKFFSRKNEACLELTVPDGIKLKAYIKDQTAKHKKEKGYKIFYNFGKDQPLVDAELLSLAIDIMNGNFNCYCKNEKSALYFSDENNNEVMLMPVGSKSKNDVTTEL